MPAPPHSAPFVLQSDPNNAQQRMPSQPPCQTPQCCSSPQSTSPSAARGPSPALTNSRELWTEQMSQRCRSSRVSVSKPTQETPPSARNGNTQEVFRQIRSWRYFRSLAANRPSDLLVFHARRHQREMTHAATAELQSSLVTPCALPKKQPPVKNVLISVEKWTKEKLPSKNYT